MGAASGKLRTQSEAYWVVDNPSTTQFLKDIFQWS